MTQTTLIFDSPALATQGDRVRYVLRDGNWRTLGEIATACRDLGHWDSEAAISARIRELPGYDPQRDKRVRKGKLFEYHWAMKARGVE